MDSRRGGRYRADDRGGYGRRRDDRGSDRYYQENNSRRRRSRSASPRRDRRDRNRSKSRDRTDRGRDRDNRDRPYEHSKNSGRGGDRRDRDGDRSRRDDRNAPLRYRDGHQDDPRPTKREESPGHNSPLPVRSKTEKSSGRSTPLSFKVGKHNDESAREENSSSFERETTTPAIPGDVMDEDVNEDEDHVEVDGSMDMAAMMGFSSFDTTKGKKVKGNDVGAVRKEKKTEYRQYMNRIGGFNRPLDSM